MWNNEPSQFLKLAEIKKSPRTSNAAAMYADAHDAMYWINTSVLPNSLHSTSMIHALALADHKDDYSLVNTFIRIYNNENGVYGNKNVIRTSKWYIIPMRYVLSQIAVKTATENVKIRTKAQTEIIRMGTNFMAISDKIPTAIENVKKYNEIIALYRETFGIEGVFYDTIQG